MNCASWPASAPAQIQYSCTTITSIKFLVLNQPRVENFVAHRILNIHKTEVHEYVKIAFTAGTNFVYGHLCLRYGSIKLLGAIIVVDRALLFPSCSNYVIFFGRTVKRKWDGITTFKCYRLKVVSGKPRNRDLFTNQKYDSRKPFSCKISSPKKSCFMNNLSVSILQTWVSEIFLFFMFRVIYSLQLKTGHCIWNVPSTQDITKRAGEKNRHDLVILSY